MELGNFFSEKKLFDEEGKETGREGLGRRGQLKKRKEKDYEGVKRYERPLKARGTLQKTYDGGRAKKDLPAERNNHNKL